MLTISIWWELLTVKLWIRNTSILQNGKGTHPLLGSRCLTRDLSVKPTAGAPHWESILSSLSQQHSSRVYLSKSATVRRRQGTKMSKYCSQYQLCKNTVHGSHGTNNNLHCHCHPGPEWEWEFDKLEIVFINPYLFLLILRNCSVLLTLRPFPK